MPARRESLALTDRYRDTLLGLRQRVAVGVASTWRAVDPDDVRGTFEAWHRGAAAIVESAQRQAIVLADAYLAAYVASETASRPRPQGVDPEPYLVREDGRAAAAELAPVLFTTLAAPVTARGLQLGLARATRVASEAVLRAPRVALGDLMVREDRVSGWRRVLGANPCGACLALADGRVHAPMEGLRRHGHCRCMREPVVRGAPDRVRRPTGRELFDALPPAAQAALFAGRGGAQKAELVRSGAVPMSALVRHEPQAVVPDQYTEASLDDLRAAANRPGA